MNAEEIRKLIDERANKIFNIFDDLNFLEANDDEVKIIKREKYTDSFIVPALNVGVDFKPLSKKGDL